MRYFTFRFAHALTCSIESIAIASSDEGDARTAAWAVLADRHPARARADWRLTSVLIRPVIDLAAALVA